MNNIATTLAAEVEYNQTVTELLDQHLDTAATYADLKACYMAHVTSPPTGLTSALALERANAASTTIDILLSPNIYAYELELENSETIVVQLSSLGEAAADATTSEEINAISIAFESLLASGVVHTTTDVAFLASDGIQVSSILSNLKNVGVTQLIECDAL